MLRSTWLQERRRDKWIPARQVSAHGLQRSESCSKWLRSSSTDHCVRKPREVDQCKHSIPINCSISDHHYRDRVEWLSYLVSWDRFIHGLICVQARASFYFVISERPQYIDGNQHLEKSEHDQDSSQQSQSCEWTCKSRWSPIHHL